MLQQEDLWLPAAWAGVWLVDGVWHVLLPSWAREYGRLPSRWYLFPQSGLVGAWWVLGGGSHRAGTTAVLSGPAQASSRAGRLPLGLTGV